MEVSTSPRQSAVVNARRPIAKLSRCSGREPGYPGPPAKIPTCGFPASGSYRRSDVIAVLDAADP